MKTSKCPDFEVDTSEALLLGDVELVDESFDHEFGVHKQYSVLISNFRIMVIVMGEEIDISTSVSPRTYQRALKQFEDDAYDHLMETHVRGGADF